MLVSDFQSSDYKTLLPAFFVKVIDYVRAQDLKHLEVGTHPIPGIERSDAFFNVIEYETATKSAVGPEFHQTYCDVQMIISGVEQFAWAEVTAEQHQSLAVEFDYDEKKDLCFIDESRLPFHYHTMVPNEFYLFTPTTIHMPGLAVEAPSMVRKVVIKIRHPR